MKSSVEASYRFSYPSMETRNPLYSWPHLSLTITALPVRLLRNGFGFMVTAPAMAEEGRDYKGTKLRLLLT